MKSVIAATVAVTAGLIVANMLGVAAAEAPTATPVRTVSVEGVASIPIAQNANLASATSVYRQGMAVAVADGEGKAEFLASKVGATLGTVQSIVEDGGSIGCTGGEESGYVEYQGEQPDFGSPPTTAAPVVDQRVAAPRSTPKRKPTAKHRKKNPSAKTAAATVCTLSADVSLLYTIN